MLGQQQQQQKRQEASFATQMAIDYEKCFSEFGAGHPPLDPVGAEALAAVHAEARGVAVILVNVRSCDYDGGRRSIFCVKLRDDRSRSLWSLMKAPREFAQGRLVLCAALFER
jgi:hypothetical protein